MKQTLITLGIALALALVPRTGTAQSRSPAAIAEGAKLYGQNCVRCHSARSPRERTDREWLTIVNHMRARANLTKSQARALTAFLQATNAPEGGSPRRAPTAEEGSADPPGAAGKAPGAPDTMEALDPSIASPATSGERDVASPIRLPILVVVDLADTRMDPDTRAAVKRYLARIRSP